MQTPYQFFLKHAGSSYYPGKETPAKGNRRNAKALAAAELSASRAGVMFEWEIDPDGSDSAGEFSSEGPFWGCTIYDPKRDAIGSLWGVDFGAGKAPWGDSYARVVQAELSLEYFI